MSHCQYLERKWYVDLIAISICLLIRHYFLLPTSSLAYLNCNHISRSRSNAFSITRPLWTSLPTSMSWQEYGLFPTLAVNLSFPTLCSQFLSSSQSFGLPPKTMTSTKRFMALSYYLLDFLGLGEDLLLWLFLGGPYELGNLRWLGCARNGLGEMDSSRISTTLGALLVSASDLSCLPEMGLLVVAAALPRCVFPFTKEHQ